MIRRTLLFAALLFSSVASAEDWANWLGPNRDGTSNEKGLLREWPKGGPEVLWRVPIDMGISCPSVRGGKVYLTSQVSFAAKETEQSIRCLDLADGHELWQVKYKDTNPFRMYRKEFGPYATPTVTGERVYTFDASGNFYCLDRSTGKEVWHRDLYSDYGSGGYSLRDKGWTSSPVVVGKVVVVNVAVGKDLKHARLLALDVDTGKESWLYETPVLGDPYEYKSSWQTPQPVDFAGETCLAIYASGWVRAVRAKDGQEVWSMDLMPGVAKPRLCMTPTIPVIGDALFITPNYDSAIVPDRTGFLVQVDRNKPPFESKVLWKVPVDGYYAQWVPHNGCLFGFCTAKEEKRGAVDDMILVCLDLKTGELNWQKDKVRQAVSLIAADGLLFIRQFNNLLLVEANGKEYTEKGRMEVEPFYEPNKANYMKGCTMPVLADGRLLVRTWHELLCLKVSAK